MRQAVRNRFCLPRSRLSVPVRTLHLVAFSPAFFFFFKRVRYSERGIARFVGHELAKVLARDTRRVCKLQLQVCEIQLLRKCTSWLKSAGSYQPKKRNRSLVGSNRSIIARLIARLVLDWSLRATLLGRAQLFSYLHYIKQCPSAPRIGDLILRAEREETERRRKRQGGTDS